MFRFIYIAEDFMAVACDDGDIAFDEETVAGFFGVVYLRGVNGGGMGEGRTNFMSSAAAFFSNSSEIVANS
jgi:hypothetical protein